MMLNKIFRIATVLFFVIGLAACDEETCREGIGDSIDEKINESVAFGNHDENALASDSSELFPTNLEDEVFVTELLEYIELAELVGLPEEQGGVALGLLPSIDGTVANACHLAATLAAGLAVNLCITEVEADRDYRKHCKKHCPRSCVQDECQSHAGDPTYERVYQACMNLL